MSPSTDRRVMSLVEAGMALASELDLDALLQRIADISREVIGADFGAVGVLGDGGELARFIYSGISKELADLIGDLPVGRGVLGALIEEGVPLRLHEISDHPRSFGFPENHPPMHSFLGVPIVVRNHIFGRLYLTEKQGGQDFSKDDERLALSFAAQAGVAIENARLIEELKNRGESLAILEERDRISKELHDGVIQSIYSVGLSLQGSVGMLRRDADIAEQRINDAIAELDNVVRDVRSYIFELQPHLVQQKGLSAAISELARDFEVNTMGGVKVDIPDEATLQLDPSTQGHVIQVIREVLSNIARHAQANEVYIGITTLPDQIVVAVEDDGVGFDIDSVRRGHGLRNIEERAARLGGTIEISPRSPKGTRHLLNIPRTAA
jgi:signal transduction histidine kinase